MRLAGGLTRLAGSFLGRKHSFLGRILVVIGVVGHRDPM